MRRPPNWSFMADSWSIPNNSWYARFADHFTTAGLNSDHFRCTFWLMILSKSSSFPLRIPFLLVTENYSRISDMAYINFSFTDKSNACCSAGCTRKTRSCSWPFICKGEKKTNELYLLFKYKKKREMLVANFSDKVKKSLTTMRFVISNNSLFYKINQRTQ